ncbi:provicilin-like [Prosopis cineraria]|uniref:provicilin-like n=1 Tax=Prosopis cineraria TaxID=364024 RepID=UPI00240F9E3D|nr:provicilin-like [Prosopis cineraria]
MDSIIVRLRLLLFLGSVILAVASIGLAYSDEQSSNYRVCVKSCAFHNSLACQARCKLTNDAEEKEEAAERDPRLPEQERREEEEEEEERPQWQREKEQEERQRRRRPGKRSGEKEEEEEGQGQEEKEQEQEEQKQQRENPYYLPSDRFQTRFENEHGRIRVLQRFDNISDHLRMLKYYRIIEYVSRPGTLLIPHHSDAEYLVVAIQGRALVTIVLPNYKQSFNLKQYDVLRVPAGAICYTINRANNQDLQLIKLALPVNIPGQFENFYPSGNHIPQSYFKAFNKKTLQAAFKAPYEEIQSVFWGSEGQEQGSEEGVIVKLEREQLRSLLRRPAQSSSSSREERESSLGPFNLRNIEPHYSNNHGSLREAHPHNYQSLQDLGIGITHLKLREGSLFLPHYNTRAIVLGFVADGEGDTEMACPHLANQQRSSSEDEEGAEYNRKGRRQSESEQRQQRQQQEEDQEEQQDQRREGQVKRLSAKLSKSGLYISPAGHPVAIRASRNSNLEVVEFILNAPYNFRNFLAGARDNVLKNIDREVMEAASEGSSKELEKLLRRQEASYFVDREDQPRGGDKSPRKPNKVAWSSILTAFM